MLLGIIKEVQGLAADTVSKEAVSQELKRQVCTTKLACRSDIFIRQKRISTAALFSFCMVLGSKASEKGRYWSPPARCPLETGDREATWK